MARLQDFQSVTPTSSDKILIVQSQGQGLAPHTIKMDSANPTGSGTLTMTGNGVFSGDCTIMGNKSVNDAITVQNVSITVDTTKITSGTITCKKVGHIAFVSLYNVAFTSSGNNKTNLVTGLPKALMQPTITSFGGDDASKTQTINTNGDTLWINANGTSLNGHISASTYNLKHYVLFSYPCE